MRPSFRKQPYAATGSAISPAGASRTITGTTDHIDTAGVAGDGPATKIFARRIQSVGYTQFNRRCAFSLERDFELLLPGEIPSAQNSLQTNLSPTRHATTPLWVNRRGSPQYTHEHSGRSRGLDRSDMAHSQNKRANQGRARINTTRK